MKIPRKILLKKLTEFVSECKNEEALSYFFKELLNVETVEWDSDELIVVTMNGDQEDYTPNELVAFMLDQIEDQGLIRRTVSYVKETFDYKTA